MILQALYEYYNRSDKVAPSGKEIKEITFLIVIKQPQRDKSLAIKKNDFTEIP